MTDAVPTPAPQKKRFGCLAIILTLLTLLFLGIAIIIWLIRTDPAQYKQMGEAVAKIPREKEQRAESLEKQLLGAAQGIDSKKGPQIKPGFNNKQVIDRTLVISVVDANIWLATRLESTLANQSSALPKIMSDPRVWIEDEQLVLSSRIKLPGIDGVVSFAVDAQMRDDGKMEMKVAKVRTGKLRVPSGVVADQVRDELKNAEAGLAKTIGQAFDGVTFDPVFEDKGDKTRQNRVMDFKILEDRVELKLRNQPKPK